MSGRVSIYRAGEERLTNHETSPTGQEKEGPPPQAVFWAWVAGHSGQIGQDGLSIGKRKDYKRMGAKGAMGLYTRRHAPWEV